MGHTFRTNSFSDAIDRVSHVDSFSWSVVCLFLSLLAWLNRLLTITQRSVVAY